MIHLLLLKHKEKNVRKFTIEDLDYLALMAKIICSSMDDNDRENSSAFHILVNSGCSS